MHSKERRVRNWKEYSKNLVRRGNITLWIDESLLVELSQSSVTRSRGRPKCYADALIKACLVLKNGNYSPP